MRHDVLLPQLELTMESVDVRRWLVAVGAQVKAEQPLLEVETQKATVEVPSPAAGFVRQLCVQEGQTIGEKALLCVLTDTANEPLDSSSTAGGLVTVDVRKSAGVHAGGSASATPNSSVATTDGIRATPLARKVARERGLDLTRIRGSGPQGRIKHCDVEASVTQSSKPAAPAPSGDWQPISATRLALIRQMQLAVAQIPQINVTRQLDVTPLLVKVPGIPGAGVTFTHRLIRAVAATLGKHPALRTLIAEDRIKVQPVSVAVAMDTPRGLVAPVLRGPDLASLQSISAAVIRLAERAAVGSLKRDELTDAPFAISNLGMLGVDQFTPLVFDGQTAVMAIGCATEAAAGRRVAWFTLAVDHRVVDGADAARFLQTLQEEILTP